MIYSPLLQTLLQRANNISVIWCPSRSVLLVEKTGEPGENHQLVTCCIESYTSPEWDSNSQH